MRVKYNYLITDLADIKHFSAKARATGTIGHRAFKKWKRKSKKRLHFGYCKGNCRWLPSTVLREEIALNKYSREKKFWWICTKCRSITQWVWEHELSEPMLNAYKEHTRVLTDEDRQEMAADAALEGFYCTEIPSDDEEMEEL